LSAQEAAGMGLVNRVFPQEAIAEEIRGIARKMAQKPPLALGVGKQLVNRAFQSGDTRAGLEEAKNAQCSLIQTQDYREGVRAFLEKREPVFLGQ